MTIAEALIGSRCNTRLTETKPGESMWIPAGDGRPSEKKPRGLSAGAFD